VFISHAGMNSVMESLYFGVPLVAVPHIQEQDENARRVEELRLGRRLPAASPECLRVVVDEVHADPEIHRSLAQMTNVVRGCGGAGAAVVAIESHLGITRNRNL
jgi:UDP:flavonoid glycosyltransferase YjiC (YdhE family)